MKMEIVLWVKYNVVECMSWCIDECQSLLLINFIDSTTFFTKTIKIDQASSKMFYDSLCILVN